MGREAWGFGLKLALAFAAWSLIAQSLLPYYARAVTPVAQYALQWLCPHDVSIVFLDAFPDVRWETNLPSQQRTGNVVSFLFLSYNASIYLALLTAVPWPPFRQRIVLLLTGLPVFFAFHIADLLLTVESRLLSRLQPEGYTFWRPFLPWFLLVKIYTSFSAMALKQALPAIVLYFQWRCLKYRLI